MSGDYTLSPPGHTPQSVKDANTQQMKDLGVLKSDRGRTQLPGIRLWGHRINLSGDDGISCEECEMEEEVPEILQMSSGFREVVYKLYILGKFKNTRCEPEFETDNSVLHDNVTVTTTGSHKLKLDDGYVIADGGAIIDSTSPRYSAGEMLTDKQWMQVVQEAQSGDAVTIGDVSSAMSDMTMMTSPQTHDDLKKDAGISTSSSSSTNTSVQMEADVDESTKEKLARKLCEKAGIR